jgi:hypothetical protein
MKLKAEKLVIKPKSFVRKVLDEKSKEFVTTGEPVISVDAKKKELVGNFKNNGPTWKKKGEADEVNVYDFLSLAEGRITPFLESTFQSNL